MAIIDKPSDYFNIVLYTGNGSTQSITGVGFQPDFVWTKDRNDGDNHVLVDAVRGSYKPLYSNSTSTEGDSSGIGGTSSFDSDGFSIGSWNNINQNVINYASWNWKANGAGSANTDGTISSTVSANTTAGFSVVSYTGNATAGSTIGPVSYTHLTLPTKRIV